MKYIKKIIVTALLFVFIVTLSDIPAFSNPAVAEAATIKLSKSTLTLEIGKKQTLKVVGTNQKVTWTSSKKTVATVSIKGLVTAKAAGKTTITASVAGKKLTCAVTVKKSSNPYLKNAPFDATESTIGNISLVMPSDWNMTTQPISDTQIGVLLTSKDKSSSSSVQISITSLDDQSMTFDAMKKDILAAYKEDYFKDALKAGLGGADFELKNFAQSDFDASFGKVIKLNYSVKFAQGEFDQYIYDFIVDNYFIEAVATDANELDLGIITEYVINSITVK